MTKDKAADSIGKLTFEEALAELEEIVRKLEEGSGDMDKAIGGYERGVLLKRHCESKLKEAEARVEKIVLGADGTVSTASVKDSGAE
jgi:exodeoxyribonuclease VII small subunit